MKMKTLLWILFVSFCYFQSISGFKEFVKNNGRTGIQQQEAEKYLDIHRDVLVELFTLKNYNEPQILKLNDVKSVIQSNYDVKIPTRIITHGYQSGGEFKNELINAFFKNSKRNVNLILINWESASFGNYFTVRGYVETLGNFTADFIKFLLNNNLLDLSNLSVIGFSLGAHIMGITGKRLKSESNNEYILRKIVGLDPAGVGFSFHKPQGRLHNNDAMYVETLHTSMIGLHNQIGTVSFFANGGLSQPQCAPTDISCSHSSSYKYFAQSVISDKPLIGHRCGTLEEVWHGGCNGNGSEGVFGGEPGAMEQPPGVYYIKM